MKNGNRQTQMTFTKKEMYMLLQSLIEAQERMSENDLQTIMNAGSNEMRALTERIDQEIERLDAQMT